LTIASSALLTQSAQAATGLQGNWYWCSRCTPLFHDGSTQPDGVCSNFSSHTFGIGPTEYGLDYGFPAGVASYQANWTWCGDCQVLFYGPNVNVSACWYSKKINSVNNQGLPAHRVGSTTSYSV